MSDQRRRRWADIVQRLYDCVMLTGRRWASIGSEHRVRQLSIARGHAVHEYCFTSLSAQLISRQEEARSRDYALVLSKDLKGYL